MPFINQVEFSYGEIDPRLINKSNLSFYVQSADKVENCLVTSITNIKKRFGLQYLLTINAVSGAYHLDEFIYKNDLIYLLIFTDLKLDIYRDDVFKATIITTFTSGQLLSKSIKTSMTNNEMIILNGDELPYKLSNGGNDITWSLVQETYKNLPTYDFKNNYDSFTFSIDNRDVGTGKKLTCDNNIFDATYVNGRFESVGNENAADSPIGSARITGFIDAKNVNIEITTSFDNSLTTGTVSGKNCKVEQPAWQTAYGWPKSICFFGGRAWYGGTDTLPNAVFGSVDYGYNNFDLGSGYDSDAVVQVLDGSDGEPVGKIKYLVGDKSLQIFCERSEQAVAIGDGTGISPSNFTIRRQSSEGISDIPPALYNNETMFVRRTGKALMGYSYDSSGDSYASKDLSRAASHLINNPIDIGVLKSLSDDDVSYMFIINTDGTLTIFTSDIDQNIRAFTSNITDGKFKAVINLDTAVYFVIERTILEVTFQYLEKLNFDLFTDSSKIYTSIPSTKTLTGLDHLNGKTVSIIGDGYVLKDKTVVGGSVTLSDDEDAITNATVGLLYIPIFTPHPPIIYGEKGSEYYLPKKIIRAFIHYYQSLGIIVDGEEVPSLALDDTAFLPPVAQTGIFEHIPAGSWNPLQTITITQNKPLPFEILGIGYEVTATETGEE